MVETTETRDEGALGSRGVERIRQHTAFHHEAISARLSADRAFGGVPRAIARFFRSFLSAADLGGLSVTETQGLEESFNPKEVPIARVNSPKNLVLAILLGKEEFWIAVISYESWPALTTRDQEVNFK